MKSSVLIIEDDIPLGVNIKIHLTQWGYDVVGIFDNGEEALEIIYEKKPTFILMDIRLSGHLTGIEIAKKISTLNIYIIFMTALNNEDSFIKAKKTKSLCYLVKPFDMLTLRGVLEMAADRTKSNPTILMRRGKQTIPTDLDSIIWIESDKNYCHIHTKDGKFSMRKSMVKFLEELSTDKIVKIHRQYAVAVDRIRKVLKTKGEIELISGKILPLGRTYKDALIEVIKNR